MRIPMPIDNRSAKALFATKEEGFTMRNPDKLGPRLRSAIAGAVRRGDITKASTCSACGNWGRLEGHHEDYSKPFELRWLCPRCHRAEHGRGTVNQSTAKRMILD